MPTFSYEALDASGKARKGELEANTHEEAHAKIKSLGFFPTALRERKTKSSAAKSDQKLKSTKRKKGQLVIAIGGVKPKILTQFTRQLSTLQDAGLSLLRSLQVLEQQAKPGLMKNIIGSVAEDVEGGSTLADAMAKHPKAFDRLYVKMVAAGEIGGVLDLILQRLADFMEKAQRLKRKIIGAMIYPAVVITIAVLIVSGIMVFVIPKFVDIFMDFGVELPWLTIQLMNTSKWMAGTQPGQHVPGFVWVLLSPFIIFLFIKLVKKTEPGRALVDRIKLLLPLVGPLVRKSVVARFTRTLGTLISAGVPILEAITITSDTSGNYVFEKALMKVHDSIREGESFANPLRETKVVDAIVVNMVDVGEETGDLDAMLLKVADNYDEEVEVAVNSLVSLLEPLMVVILGVIVGSIVVALFLPLVRMIDSLGSQTSGGH